jgi:hypothetical protein
VNVSGQNSRIFCAGVRCTCGGEESDGRGDVLACAVHGIGDHLANRIGGPGSPGPQPPRRKSHGRYGRGDDHVPCALCDGYGDVVNPENADPERAITEWLPPVGCPRCGQTGRDPKPGGGL